MKQTPLSSPGLDRRPSIPETFEINEKLRRTGSPGQAGRRQFLIVAAALPSVSFILTSWHIFKRRHVDSKNLSRLRQDIPQGLADKEGGAAESLVGIAPERDGAPQQQFVAVEIDQLNPAPL